MAAEVVEAGAPVVSMSTDAVALRVTRIFELIPISPLNLSGDGDGAAELQMFVLNDKNYTYNMPQRYKYRLDVVLRNDPVLGFPYKHTRILGADACIGEWIAYEVPDVNSEDVTYDFYIDRWKKVIDLYGDGTTVEGFKVDYFPLFQLSTEPGPWRLVLVDDDKDYPDFNRRRDSEYAHDIWTFNMATGNWEEKYTGFTVESRRRYSSDDAIWESGVRNITIANVSNQENSNGDVIATKYYPGGYFSYTFSLETQSLRPDNL